MENMAVGDGDVLSKAETTIRTHILYGCTNLECDVATFIREPNCPGCGVLGIEVRQPIYDKYGISST